MGLREGFAVGAGVDAGLHVPRGSLPEPGIRPGLNGALALHTGYALAPMHLSPSAQSFVWQQPWPTSQLGQRTLPPQPHHPDLDAPAHAFHPVMGPFVLGSLHERSVGKVVGVRVGRAEGAGVIVGLGVGPDGASVGGGVPLEGAAVVGADGLDGHKNCKATRGNENPVSKD